MSFMDSGHTFSLLPQRSQQSWRSGQSADLPEMQNLLDSEELPEPSTSSSLGTATGNTGIAAANRNHENEPPEGVGSINSPDVQFRDHVVIMHRQSSALPTGLDTEREETLKCIFSSVLFFSLIFSIFVVIFWINPPI